MAIDLTRLERVHLLRRCAGRLQADTDPAVRWLGESLQVALQNGISLDDAVGIRPARGSKATAAQMIRREQNDIDICRLVDMLGVVGTSRALRGEVSAPSELVTAVDRLHDQGVGTSPSAVSRAARRARHKQ